MSSGLMEPLNPTTHHLPRIVENPIHDVENQVILEKPILIRSVAMDYEYQLLKEDLSRSFGHGGGLNRGRKAFGIVFGFILHNYGNVS